MAGKRRKRTSRSSRPRIRFTEEILEAIPVWVSLGASPTEIAAALGTTAPSLHMTCSRRGISLARGAYFGGFVSSKELDRKMAPEQVERLRKEAVRRQTPIMQLVVDIIVGVAQYELFNAVLGDYDEERAA